MTECSDSGQFHKPYGAVKSKLGTGDNSTPNKGELPLLKGKLFFAGAIPQYEA